MLLCKVLKKSRSGARSLSIDSSPAVVGCVLSCCIAPSLYILVLYVGSIYNACCIIPFLPRRGEKWTEAIGNLVACLVTDTRLSDRVYSIHS
jgi:hypothetical protein